MASDPSVDNCSLVPVLLETKFNDVHVANATGFLWLHDNRAYLVSNWHVFSGRHPETSKLLNRDLVVPNEIDVKYHGDHHGTWKTVRHRLHADADDSRPDWIMHPRGQDVDVAALPVAPPEGALPYFLNQLPERPMALRAGTEAFVLGFPFAVAVGGNWPIWKRASIASEPSVDVRALPCFYIDTATRDGMSGSPVVLHSFVQYHQQNGMLSMTNAPNARFIGVYSGRVGAKDELSAQLGIVWRKEVVEEIMLHGIAGTFRPLTE